MLKTKKDLIAHCLTYPDVYEDYPFHDHEWAVIRHRSNRRVFAWIYRREGASGLSFEQEILEHRASGRHGAGQGDPPDDRGELRSDPLSLLRKR